MSALVLPKDVRIDEDETRYILSYPSGQAFATVYKETPIGKQVKEMKETIVSSFKLSESTSAASLFKGTPKSLFKSIPPKPYGKGSVVPIAGGAKAKTAKPEPKAKAAKPKK